MVQPGIILSQTFPEARNIPGGMLEAARSALKANVDGKPIRLLHMPDLLDPEELPAIRLLIEETGATVIYCVTRALNEAMVSLSSLDTANRKAALALAKRQLFLAAEAGASYMDVISGPRPAQGPREPALDALLDSLCELAGFAHSETPGVRLQIEPLDHCFHKQNTLGTTAEAVALCASAERRGAQVGLCLDTAHMGLNFEDIPSGIEHALPYLTEFHLCNCCVEQDHPLAGDQHIAPGAPGLFHVTDYGRFVRELDKAERNVMLFVEVLKPPHMTGEEQLNACRAILEGCV